MIKYNVWLVGYILLPIQHYYRMCIKIVYSGTSLFQPCLGPLKDYRIVKFSM